MALLQFAPVQSLQTSLGEAGLAGLFLLEEAIKTFAATVYSKTERCMKHLISSYQKGMD